MEARTQSSCSLWTSLSKCYFKFLKQCNDLYEDVTTVPNNMPKSLTRLLRTLDAEWNDTYSIIEYLESEEDYLVRYRVFSNKAFLILDIPEVV